MKLTVAIFAALAAFAPQVHAAHSEGMDIAELNDIIDDANFIVGSGKGKCSATLISTKYRLLTTAHHCVDDDIKWITKDVVENGEVKAKKVEVRSNVTVQQKVYQGASQVGGSEYKARIVAYSDYRLGHDLALLQLIPEKVPMTLDFPPLPKGRDAVRGEPVVIVSNPAMLDASLTNGIVVSTSRERESRTGEKTRLLQTNAGAFFGSSGGMLATADGHYLGTVVGGIPGAQVVFAVHYEHLHNMLTESCYGSLYDPEAPTYEVCDAERKAKAEEDEETVKGLLKKLVTQSTPGSARASDEVSDVEAMEACTLTTLMLGENFAYTDMAECQ